MINIEHDDWSLTVDPMIGGSTRLLSWKGHQILSPAKKGSSHPLEMASFPLAPFSNRIDLGGFEFGQRFFPLPPNMEGVALPIHGFAWLSPWSVSEQRANGVSLSFVDDGSLWPEPYKVEQNIAIDGNCVRFSIALTNLGKGDMPAGIGFHPYFPRGQCECTINPGKMWEQDAHGLPARLSVQHPLDRGRHLMSEVRLDHSFSGWDGTAVLTDSGGTLRTQISTSESLRELLVYCPDDDFFCLEPVSHVTNAVHGDTPAKRKGWRLLESGETLSGWFELTVRKLV